MKAVLPSKKITGDLSANFTSNPLTVDRIDAAFLVINWTGTVDVNGTLIIEVRNGIVGLDNTDDISPWVALDLGTPIAIAGAAGTHWVDITTLEPSQLQVRYAYTAGTSGTIYVWTTAKAKGN